MGNWAFEASFKGSYVHSSEKIEVSEEEQWQRLGTSGGLARCGWEFSHPFSVKFCKPSPCLSKERINIT